MTHLSHDTIPEDDPWEQEVERFVDGHRRFGEEDDGFYQETSSAPFDLLERFARMAVDEAKARGLTPRTAEADALFKEVTGPGRTVFYALNLPNPDETLSDEERFYRYELFGPVGSGNTLRLIERHGPAPADLASLETGVTAYLRRSARDPHIDRTLVLMLLYTELSNYIWSVVQPDPFGGLSRQDQLRRGLGRTWFRNRVVALGLTIAFCAALFAAGMVVKEPGLTWLFVLGALAVTGFVSWTALSFILMLLARPSVERERRKEFSTIATAALMHREFRTNAAISVRHLRERLDEARADGLLWPQSLYALLDDLAQRETQLI